MNKIWPWVGIPFGIGVLLLLMVVWTSGSSGDRSKNIDKKIGRGPAAKLGDTVTIRFILATEDGTFDSGKQGPPEKLVLEKNNRGKSEVDNRMNDFFVDGIIGMKEGGVRRLVFSLEAIAGKKVQLPPGQQDAERSVEIELLKVESH